MWECEPIRSPELVRICKERLGWKETTSYTVMKRLEERGVLKVENKIVTSIFSKDQIQAAELDEFVVGLDGVDVVGLLPQLGRQHHQHTGHDDVDDALSLIAHKQHPDSAEGKVRFSNLR